MYQNGTKIFLQNVLFARKITKLFYIYFGNVSMLRNSGNIFILSARIAVTPSMILFGNYKGRQANLFNTYFLLTKFYLYRCKTQDTPINFSQLVRDFATKESRQKSYLSYRIILFVSFVLQDDL